MKKMILLLALVLSLSAHAGPRVVGNGGGGIYENGIYKTFYSSGVLVHPRQETEIPGMNLLNETIFSITDATKVFPAYLPSEERTYYKIVESDLNQKNIERLLEEYRRVIGQSDNIAIFAITDINAKATYLLPSFYELTEIEQAAILFHEAYWILNPTSSYHNVVNAEIAFQEYVQGIADKKYFVEFPRILGKIVNDPNVSLRASLRFDMENQTTPKLISKNGIRLLDMFPEKHCSWGTIFWWDEKKVRGDEYGISEKDYIVCKPLEKSTAQIYYVELQRKYPQSKFVNEMRNKVLSGDYDHVFNWSKYAEGETLKSAIALGLDSKMNMREYKKLKEKMDQFLNNYRIDGQNLNLE